MAASKIQPNMGIWHLIAGIVIAVLGVYVWFNPAATLLGLALYLGIIFIVVGAGYFMLSFSNRSGWYLTVGILDMLVGVIFVGNLGLTAATLPIVLALWFLAIGVMQIVESFSLRREGYSWGWSLLAGVLGVLFAFLILAYPAIGAVTITALVGAYFFMYGVIEIGEYVSNRRLMPAEADI